MAILAKPSRSYAHVDHDPDGVHAVGSLPYGRKDGFKTYRPSLVETHLKRPAFYDPNPNSAFSPLPPAFNLSHKARKDQQVAGQRAELDHILQPGYKTSQPDLTAPDSASTAGPSRSQTTRTAGGHAAERKTKAVGLGLRSSASLSSFKTAPTSTSSGRMGGIYIDSNGKIHDTEFDPFAGVSEMSRRKSRRRSAFGSNRRKGSGSESSSVSGSDSGNDAPRKSLDGAGGPASGEDEEGIRRRLESERRRLDEVSGLAAARRSMVSEKSSGRATPSIRSSEDGFSAASTHLDRATGKSRSQQGYYVPSPLSPTFQSQSTAHVNGNGNGASYASRNNHHLTAELSNPIEEFPPQKSTERTSAATPKETRERERPPMSISVNDKKILVTGFDAPPSARATSPKSDRPHHSLSNQLDALRINDPARLSSSSRRSSESTRPPKPPARSREDLYPETPAQVKKREDRERRTGRPSAAGLSSRAGSLGIDTALSASSRARPLPEIEIVEDDDPRIIIPEHGKTTRVQTTHDHVIRGPFSLALNAGAGGGFPGEGSSVMGGMGRRASADQSARSIQGVGVGVGSGSKAPSTIIDQGTGGYLPSRWASGDRALRTTEDEKEKYRPREWGGKTGDLGGRPEEWRPSAKDSIKRNWKELSTNARFSMFRAKKKILRKADI